MSMAIHANNLGPTIAAMIGDGYVCIHVSLSKVDVDYFWVTFHKYVPQFG